VTITADIGTARDGPYRVFYGSRRGKPAASQWPTPEATAGWPSTPPTWPATRRSATSSRRAPTPEASAPPYIEQALGARPESPRERGGWDQAVRAIERYRARHGINDRERALGPVPRDLPRRTAHRELERAQQALGREHQLNLAREAGRHVRVCEPRGRQPRFRAL
jgi:hypothetical protein